MWMVFIKEMKEVVRDRKTMFFMILLPLLIFPLIIGAVAYFSTKAAQDAQSKTLTYAIVNAEAAPQIDAALAKADGFKRLSLPANTSIDSWVKSDGADFVLAVPPDYDADPLQAGNNNLELYYNGAGFNAIEARLNTLIDPIAKANQRAAFDRLEITPAQQSAIMAPIVIKDINVADERENIGEVLGGLVAYVIFILCLQGAMIPAADLGAGEKERGTLETLLISPIDRHKIVLGKFLTIATAGVTTALISVLSMAVWGILVGQSMAIEVVTNFMGAIGLIDFLLIFLMLIPVVAIFAAVLLSLSIYAKTFKEAQSYMGPLVMVIIVSSFDLLLFSLILI